MINFKKNLKNEKKLYINYQKTIIRLRKKNKYYSKFQLFQVKLTKYEISF